MLKHDAALIHSLINVPVKRIHTRGQKWVREGRESCLGHGSDHAVTNDGSPEPILLNIGADDEHRPILHAREGDTWPSETIMDLQPE